MAEIIIKHSENSCWYINNKSSYWQLDSKLKAHPTEPWTLEKKQKCISSILMGYDIGTIYIHDRYEKPFTRPDTYYREIIDGKERIKAICEFINNKFPVTPDSDFISYNEYAGKTFAEIKEMNEDTAEYFYNRKIAMTEIRCDDENTLRDMIACLCL